VILATVVEQ